MMQARMVDSGMERPYRRVIRIGQRAIDEARVRMWWINHRPDEIQHAREGCSLEIIRMGPYPRR